MSDQETVHFYYKACVPGAEVPEQTKTVLFGLMSLNFQACRKKCFPLFDEQPTFDDDGVITQGEDGVAHHWYSWNIHVPKEHIIAYPQDPES